MTLGWMTKMPEDKDRTDIAIVVPANVYLAEVTVVPSIKSTAASVAEPWGVAVVVASKPDVSLTYPVEEMSRRERVLRENRKLPVECSS
jgi:hypothetical protein